MATIKDIAQEAGCSIRTVSRVINNSTDVKEGTRQKINEIIRRNGFEPNASARSLKTNRKNTIALVLGTVESDINRRRVETITRLFNTIGCALLVNRASTFEQEQDVVRQAAGRADGLIVFSHLRERRSPLFDRLISDGVPLLLVDPPVANDYPSVYIDRSKGYRDAVKLAVERHRQKPLLVAGDYMRRDRVDGFRRGLEQCGLTFRDDMVRDIDGDDFEGGYRLGHELAPFIQSGDPDALICQNDKVALGLIAFFHEHGVRVPDDVAVIGFDDDNYAAYTTPALTTIAQGGSRVGVFIYEQLYNFLEHQVPMESTTFATRLVVRKSA